MHMDIKHVNKWSRIRKELKRGFFFGLNEKRETMT